MTHKPRALRRAHDQRMKARTRRIMRLWSGRLTNEPPDPRKVGVNASTHCRPVRLLDVPGEEQTGPAVAGTALC